jgi:chromosomal replication initiator protein
MNDQQIQAARPSGRPVSANIIIEETCFVLSVKPQDLFERGRHFRVCIARGLSGVLMRELTSLSFPDIAEKLFRPRTSHSSVQTAVRRVQRQIDAGIPVGPESERVIVAEAYSLALKRVLARQQSADMAA